MKNNSEKTIRVKASKSYDVVIGRGLLDRTGELIKGVVSPCKVALVTDDVVDGLYSDKVAKSIKKAGFTVVKYVFPQGEQNKNLDTYAKILCFLAQNEISRSDVIVALGGGVVGDTVGFASATFMRGIKYIQIPTTLLSQIDSSVGGKTAVDLPQGKNLVGAFCQPSLVICDVDTLDSLSEEIYLDGMGEMVKYAVLDKTVFDLLSNDSDILDLVHACIDYKRKIVEQDEFEGGKRRLLNFGHTPAHGIEKLSGYKISHGNAVATGVKIMVENSYRLGYLSKDDYLCLSTLVEKIVGKKDYPFEIKDIMEQASMDKKRSGEFIYLLFAYGIGDVREVKTPISSVKEYVR